MNRSDIKQDDQLWLDGYLPRGEPCLVTAWVDGMQCTSGPFAGMVVVKAGEDPIFGVPASRLHRTRPEADRRPLIFQGGDAIELELHRERIGGMQQRGEI